MAVFLNSWLVCVSGLILAVLLYGPASGNAAGERAESGARWPDAAPDDPTDLDAEPGDRWA